MGAFYLGWFVVNMSNRIKEKIQNIFRKQQERVEPDINKLPEKIGRHKVVIQYTPPKWLSPSEVGFLYHRKFQSTDLDAMLYDWAYKWYISIKNSNTYRTITNIKTLQSEKEYEWYCWHLFFWYKEWEKCTVHFRKITSFFYCDKMWEKLLKYCKGKWWLTYEVKDYLSKFLLFIYLWIPLMFFWFALSSIAVGGSILWWLIFLIIAAYVLYRIITNNGAWIKGIKKIELTDEWDKLLAHIYWYKYYLEKCEEEQFKQLMEDDPNFLDKTLPYIIALRLNWYFLENQSIFHYIDMSLLSKIAIYVAILVWMLLFIFL